jgi:uncharacterized protein (DUF58 family)
MSYWENPKIREFNNLDLLARQVVEGFIIGLHKSPFHGFSVEFAEHRIYNQGESTKNIDWKVFARTNKLFTKRFEEETNLRCQIVIDTSSSMYFPERKAGDKNYLNKLYFSSLAAASLMQLLQKQRDAFGLSLLDETVYTHSQCKSSTTHYRLLLSYLEKKLNSPVPLVTTSTSQALHQIAESIHKRSLVIIFSDMFETSDDQDAMFASLQHLKHNMHEVILFHVTDKKLEIDFDFEDRPYLFVDLETGNEVKLQAGLVKESYKEESSLLLKNLKMKCLQYKIDFVEADINEGFHPILQRYLVKRSKMKVG